MSDKNVLVDFNKIENNDKKYVYSIFREYLQKYNSQKKAKTSYFYQYEFDSNQTIYELLMGSHMICIEADNLKLANLLNAILRVLIDDHTYSLEIFTDENNNVIKTLLFHDFFTEIESFETLKMYKGYKSESIKKYINERLIYYISINKKLEKITILADEFDPVRIFNKNVILKILSDLINKACENNDTIYSKKEKLLNILKEGKKIEEI